MRRLEAVYEAGVLRPTEKLPLEEHQLVSVIILDADADDEDIEFEPPHCFEALADRSIARETVRALLSNIPGALDADFAAERDERCSWRWLWSCIGAALCPRWLLPAITSARWRAWKACTSSTPFKLRRQRLEALMH